MLPPIARILYFLAFLHDFNGFPYLLNYHMKNKMAPLLKRGERHPFEL